MVLETIVLPITPKVLIIAEGKGFEPLVRSSRTPVFKTGTINQL